LKYIYTQLYIYIKYIEFFVTLYLYLSIYIMAVSKLYFEPAQRKDLILGVSLDFRT